MKKSVELNAEKVKLAKKLSRATTLKDLLDQALDALIAHSRRATLKDMLGTGFFEGDLSKVTKRSGRSRF